MYQVTIIDSVQSIILAAGKGVRMKSDLPKVLHCLNRKPLIQHVVDNIARAGVSRQVIVVGYKGEQVIEVLGGSYVYVWQREQLGTGHAVLQAEESLHDFHGRVLVACGDVPLIRPETFRALINRMSEQVRAVVLTMQQDNPTGYGRIIKENGRFVRIVEEKDANAGEKAITEVNTGTYIFDKDLLFSALKKVGTNNAQKEYYLPDVLQFIREASFDIDTLLLEDATEGSGINSREDLALLEERLAMRQQ